MRIPILVTLPAQETLRESASAFRAKRVPTRDLSRTAMPAGIQLDTTFSAVPIGKGGLFESLASHEPEVSENFAVRGFVEATDATNIPKEMGGRLVFADPQIRAFQPQPMTCGGTAPVGNTQTVQSKLRVAQLAAKQLDGSGIAIAIMDTGINLAHVSGKLGHAVLIDAANSWVPAGLSILPGNHPVDHGSMCAYDALVIAPKATLLDFPILSSHVPGGSQMGGSLSAALQAFAQLIANWAVAFAPGGIGTKYRGLVISNSWGIFHPSWDFPIGHPGRYCDNPRHPFNLIVSTLASTGADIIFAAGNCGAQCADGRCNGRTQQAIMGASAHQDVLTLAGCDTNDRRVGYSSQGPSIAGMFQQKPDITAYTHFLGSEAFGAGAPDTGTSAACPVAAGCVAALRTKLGTSLRSCARPLGR
jgi:Subtilase family